MRIGWPGPNRRIGIVDALALTGLVGLLVARFVPLARLPFWGCALRETTGWPCLGCGRTRVAEHVSHLEVGRAWEVNPLGTIAALAFVAAILLSAAHLAFRLPMPDVRLTDGEKRAAQVLAVAAVAVNWGWMAAKAKLPELIAGGG